MSIRSNKFTPKQVGINLRNSEYKNHSFLVKKKCFHLFWIPFFPLETLFIVKNQKTGQTFTMPDDFKHYIQKHHIGVNKNPFWTFSGPIVFLLTIVLFTGMLSYKEYKRDGYYYKSAKNKAKWVDKAIIGDYYNFWIRPKSKNGKSKKIYLVVSKVKKDSLDFMKMFGNMQIDSLQETGWLKKEIQDSLAQLVILKNNKIFTFSKEDIKKTINTDRSLRFKNSYPIEGLGKADMYTFSSYYRINETFSK